MIENLTIAFVSKNGSLSLVEAVRSTGWKAPVLIIQNNCVAKHNNHVREHLWEPERSLQIRELDQSLSLPAAWNACIRYAETPWVLICNDDVIFDRDWALKLEAVMRDYPSALQFNLAYPASSFSGFLLHKQLVWQLGWFEESFPGYCWEDEDWYLRLEELKEQDVGLTWRGDEKPLIVWAEAIRNDHGFRRKDERFHGGSLGWDLSKEASKRAFWSKWRPLIAEEVKAFRAGDAYFPLSKGQIHEGKKIRLARIKPDTDPHPYVRAGYDELPVGGLF